MRVRRNPYLGILLAIITCWVIPSGSTVAGQVSFSPPSQSATPYDTFDVNIVVDTGVRALGCFNVQVSFLRPDVTVLGVTEGPLLKNTGSSFGWTAKDTLGVWDIFDCVLPPKYANGPGVLATMRFATGASPCSTPLQFVYVYFQDTIGQPVTVGSADGMIVVPGCCSCPSQGDINNDGSIDVFDVISVIDVAFSGGQDIQDPGCPIARSDVNNDQVVDVFDVIYIIGTAFSGGSLPIDPCNSGG
ncbi:MAG: hypothetical protein HZB43_01590 [candidate division Zixibacteria bacterium]|nr:hypothetical protein [candidate division Zixibacteria bacterium]